MLVAVQLSVLGIVSPAGVQIAAVPSIRPRRSFRCRSRLPCGTLGQWARWWCWWLSNYPCWDYISRRCSNSCSRQIHPRRSFHCQSTLPCDALGQRRVGGAGGCPTIRAGIVSPAGVQDRSLPAVTSAPDDHFTASPDCRVTVSGSWARWWCWWPSRYHQCIVGTIRYCRKSIVSTRRCYDIRNLVFRTGSPGLRRHSVRHRSWSCDQICYQTLRQHRPGQTLRDDKGIVPERFKEFAQHFGLFGVLRHAIHLSLQLLSSDRLLPVILQRLRIAQIILRLSFRSAPATSPHRAMAWDQDALFGQMR